ncbi:hypothetical protein Rumeso_02996 [Rubellimicrobium mesophilum DSM 19309]|uniref:ABC transporter domain-containing protein n=1 Tax=Rubellimicrobium mesophilum DSM 19309 TaxID=442562 RepID=A0A017HM42_9RHOB|nr:hypothetical protein Rumeso_02996 [Rubellimicrobium mesophilum DSM 19309]
MAEVQLRGVRKSFGSVEVIKGVDLTVASGSFCVFVGPSGCGKSTLLRMIAGLEEVTDGQILIGGQDVTWAEPSERGIAMVFQNYALYPHLTVAQNIGFGLSLARLPKAEIEAKVRAAADILQLTHLLDRKPKALSGGQRQRVAIGRAIVRDPKVFLFDEPLSNLDASLRAEMRLELADLHHRLDATMIYVTHDQVEAMTMADQIVVLQGGRIEQAGAPMDLYGHPATPFVAGFIGSPKMNLFGGEAAKAMGRRDLRHPAGARAAVPEPGTLAGQGAAHREARRRRHRLSGGASTRGTGGTDRGRDDARARGGGLREPRRRGRSIASRPRGTARPGGGGPAAGHGTPREEEGRPRRSQRRPAASRATSAMVLRCIPMSARSRSESWRSSSSVRR